MDTATPTSALLTDARARTIASWWADGDNPADPLMKFYLLGYIDGATALRIDEMIESAEKGDDIELRQLLAYVKWHGHRQPVTGWDSLPEEDES